MLNSKLWFFFSFIISSFLAAETNIILIRHGLAEHNVQDCYNSNPIHPNYKPSHLMPEGAKKALDTSLILQKQGFNAQTIHAVYVSPLPRTKETAYLLAVEGLIATDKIVYDQRLSELRVGDLEGKMIVRPWSPSLNEVYHSETDTEIDQRITDFLNSLTLKDGETILIVTHGYIAQRIMKALEVEVKKLEPGEAVVFTK